MANDSATSWSDTGAVFREQIKASCKPHPEIFVSAIIAIAFVVILSFDKGSNTLLLLWTIVTSIILALRFIYITWFNRLDESQISVTQAHIFTSIMLVWGVAWGLGTLAFFPLLSVPQQAAWFAMFMVMISASATSHASYLKAFFAFAIPYFLCVIWVIATEFPSPFHINACFALLIMITQAGAAFKGNRAMLNSLKLRFQNLHLIRDLKEQKDAAEKANLAKTKFLAAASHDLRQPLHALTLFSTALQDSIDNGDKTVALAKQIGESVDALQGLFNALLDISRLDAGTLICEKEHFNSRTLFEKLNNDFELVAQQKQLTLTWDYTPTALFTDPTLLQLILRNIVSNSLRYTKTGGVEIQLTPHGEEVCIDVIDTGIGIPVEQQQKVFEEFTQLHNPERDREKGLGLGLSIVKRVANLIGSSIYLSSQQGVGTSFSLLIAKGNPQKIPQFLPNQQFESNNNQDLVIVVDDEATILSAMRSLLEGWGYAVVLAQDLPDAMNQLKNTEQLPSCIVADLRLRDNITGIDVIGALRAHFNQHIPALVISGDIAVDRLKQVNDAGLVMLHKPLQPARLRTFLQKVSNI